jgi:glutathione S-transferase
MIRLHHVAFSRSFRILWLLEEMGLSCDIANYQIGDGSLRSPEFLAISPAGRVPALEVDGRVIFESGAIVEYLCETRPEHGLGRLPGDAERVAFHEWMGFAETQASILASLNLQQVFLRAPAKPSAAVLKLETARLAATLKILDQHLKGRRWLLNTGFSAVDTMMGYNVLAAPYYVHMDRFEHLNAYIERFAERPAFVRARERDGEQQFYSKPFYPIEG